MAIGVANAIRCITAMLVPGALSTVRVWGQDAGWLDGVPTVEAWAGHLH